MAVCGMVAVWDTVAMLLVTVTVTVRSVPGAVPAGHGRAEDASLVVGARRVGGRGGRGTGSVAPGQHRGYGHGPSGQCGGRDANPGLGGTRSETPIAGPHGCLLLPWLCL